MRISWAAVVGVILLVAMVSYSIAEEITLNTFYPSPRGVYNELLANVYRDLGDPANRFLDPTGTSQLQDLQLFGTVTLGGKTIGTWAEALPSGAVLLQDTLPCPGGYTALGGGDLGRFPVIAATAGGTGGSLTTDQPDALTAGAAGATSVASPTHTHTFLPPFRNFVFCRRD